ncbi:unnamed protein product [Acanthoscelides obtectus]|uniref:Uncharacterized protein n=1 Tax=Acanthoscelides obtectus TaxID=200917 RepID=A0A9P0PPS0_ACAOB|nr:unnamed protein product [Acanthoscelides obtectus]CAK1655236.1 hypothetical protein AOBTE_LOCUS19095 [Acanthoscelides obtectus]
MIGMILMNTGKYIKYVHWVAMGILILPKQKRIKPKLPNILSANGNIISQNKRIRKNQKYDIRASETSDSDVESTVFSAFQVSEFRRISNELFLGWS